MAKVAQATFGFQCVGDGVNDQFTPASEFTFTNPNSPPPYTFYLQPGVNTVPVAPGTLYGIYLKFPKGSTNAKTIKGVSGDTGWPIHAYCPFFATFAGSVTQFVMLSTSTELMEMYPD